MRQFWFSTKTSVSPLLYTPSFTKKPLATEWFFYIPYTSFVLVSLMQKRRVFLGVLSVSICAIFGYILFFLYTTTLPLESYKLRGFTYVASQPSACTDCPVVFFYRKYKKRSNTCLLAEVTTNLSRAAEAATTKKVLAKNITIQNLDERLTKKWTAKYIFDQDVYERFLDECNLNW